MGRTYAGILGPLAMATVICRGILAGAGADGTLSIATLNLIVFAAVGLIVGTIAQSTIDEAIQTKLQQQLEQAELAEDI